MDRVRPPTIIYSIYPFTILMKYAIAPLLTLALFTATPLHAKPDRAADAKEALAAKKAAAAKGKNKKGAAPTPASLVADMQKAVDLIAKQAQDAKEPISLKAKETRPFWDGLRMIDTSLAAMTKSLKAKDTSMAKALEDAGAGMVVLSTSWGILREAYPKSQVGTGVIALSEAYNLYSHHYGPAVARYKKGGKISPAEMAEVTKASTLLQSFRPKLAKLEKQAKHNTYPQRMAMDELMLIDELLALEMKHAKQYAAFLYQWERFKNTLYGYGLVMEHWYPDYFVKWDSCKADVVGVFGMFATAGDYYTGWDYYSLPVTDYGVYYERTAVLTTVTTAELASYEHTIETYSESTATEVSEEEETLINEETEVDEDEEQSLFEEVEMSADDHDGDGVSDEDDEDDGNDGSASDDESNEEEDMEEAQADDDVDDDGIADDVESEDGDGDE